MFSVQLINDVLAASLLLVEAGSLELRGNVTSRAARRSVALELLPHQPLGRRVLGRLAVHASDPISFYLFFTFPSLLNNFVVRFFHLVEASPRDVAFGFHVFEVAINLAVVGSGTASSSPRAVKASATARTAATTTSSFCAVLAAFGASCVHVPKSRFDGVGGGVRELRRATRGRPP